MLPKWFTKLWRFKEPAIVAQTRNSSASVTAQLDQMLLEVGEETKAQDALQVSSRKAANASRRVVAGTGQYKAAMMAAPKAEEK